MGLNDNNYPEMELPIDTGQSFEKTGFDANLPGDVRHDKSLEMGARVLYSEIRGLSNQYGYCFASREFLAFQFDVDVKTIKRWISSLEEQGYIKSQKVRNTNNGKLYIIYRIAGSKIADEEKWTKMSKKNGQKCPKKMDKNVHSNNKSNNNKSIYKDIKNKGSGSDCQEKVLSKSKFGIFDQRQYDFDALEQAIINKPLAAKLSEGDTG